MELKIEEFNMADSPKKRRTTVDQVDANRGRLTSFGGHKASVLWPADADNGLSYTKMEHVIKIRHPRKDVKGERKVHSWCCAKTGWHWCDKETRQSDI